MYRLLPTSLICLGLLAPASASAWWQDDWQYRKQVSVDTTRKARRSTSPVACRCWCACIPATSPSTGSTRTARTSASSPPTTRPCCATRSRASTTDGHGPDLGRRAAGGGWPAPGHLDVLRQRQGAGERQRPVGVRPGLHPGLSLRRCAGHSAADSTAYATMRRPPPAVRWRASSVAPRNCWASRCCCRPAHRWR